MKQACQFETFKLTAHPSQSRTNVLFCKCRPCQAARFAEQRLDTGLKLGPLTVERLKALSWTPPKPEDEAANTDSTESP